MFGCEKEANFVSKIFASDVRRGVCTSVDVEDEMILIIKKITGELLVNDYELKAYLCDIVLKSI